MTETLLLQILAGLHIVAAAVFVGGNVLLHFLIRRLALVPPADAMVISSALGYDITILNAAALIVAGATGFGRIAVAGDFDRYGTAGFWSTSYGVAMAFMIVLWLSLLVSGFLLARLRMVAVAKLPFDATREEVDVRVDSAVRAASAINRLGWYNLAVGLALLMIGGFLEYGGLVWRSSEAAPSSSSRTAAATKLFVSAGCGSCHEFGPAGTGKGVGPSLDGLRISALEAAAVIANGRGAMEAQGSRLTDAEIAEIARLLTEDSH